MRIGRPRIFEKMAAISFGVTRWSFQFDDPSATPRFLKQLSRHTPDIRSSNHRDRLVEWLQEARNHTVVARRNHVPAGVLHEPGWPQKRNRHRQLDERLLHECELSEQVCFGRLRTDRRQAHDFGRTRYLKR